MASTMQVVVEHDEEAIRTADYLVDLGPGAGVHGGHIIARGTPEDMAAPESLTGQYLTQMQQIAAGKTSQRARASGPRIKVRKRITLKISMSISRSVRLLRDRRVG